MPDKLQLGKNEYSVERVGLRKWLQLENLRSKIVKAAEDRDRHSLVSHVYSYLSAALPIEELDKLPWYEVVTALFEISDANRPILRFPMLLIPSKGKKEADWDYEGRNWYSWANMLAHAYGWTLKYIENLDIDDSIGLLQEILSDRQSEREWEWSLSEIAYPYNAVNKKSEFKPLPRPEWMTSLQEVKEPKKIKIKQDMLPVGNVIKYDDSRFRKSD